MTSPWDRRLAEILVVEDDPGDILLIRRAMKDASFRNPQRVVNDGSAAMAWLRGEPPYAEALRPDLILLDLNLPKKSGREVLADIKADPRLRRIPVVILSTSNSVEDVLRTYDLQASAYLQKPTDVHGFLRAIKGIGDFYLGMVILPP